MGGLSSATNGLGITSGYKADPSALLDPTNKQQLNDQYANTQSGLAQQQAFLDALKAQNGIANQSNVYNQLGNIAAGQGPNPAQAMLAQATGANTANQAALMAGQRGAGANTGLIARQAAQQGAANQQAAVGQGATMQANQALNALNMQGGLATQQVGQQANATGAYNQFAQNEQNNLLNAATQHNNAMNSANSINAGTANANATATGNLISNIGGAAGSVMGLANGGQVPPHAPQSSVANYFHKMAAGGMVPAMVSPGEVYVPPKNVAKVAAGADPRSQGEVIPGKAKVKGDSFKNDTVPKNLAEGGFMIPKSIMESDDVAKKAAAFVAAHLAKRGKLPKKVK